MAALLAAATNPDASSALAVRIMNVWPLRRERPGPTAASDMTVVDSKAVLAIYLLSLSLERNRCLYLPELHLHSILVQSPPRLSALGTSDAYTPDMMALACCSPTDHDRPSVVLDAPHLEVLGLEGAPLAI